MTDTTNLSTLLAELWELSDHGKAEWWCPHVYIEESGPLPKRYVAVLRLWGGDESQIESDIALDLITASAERWLVGRGWEIRRDGDGVRYTQWAQVAMTLVGTSYENGAEVPFEQTYPDCKIPHTLNSLTEALRYEMEKA